MNKRILTGISSIPFSKTPRYKFTVLIYALTILIATSCLCSGILWIGLEATKMLK